MRTHATRGRKSSRPLMIFAATIVLLAPRPGVAGEGRDIAEGWKAWGESTQFITIAAVEESADGRVTVLRGYEARRTGTLKLPPAGTGKPQRLLSYTLSLTVPEIRFEGLSWDGSGYSAAVIEAPEAVLHGSLSDGDETMSLTETLNGFTSIEPKWQPTVAIPDDPTRPFSRFEPAFRAFVQFSSKSVVIDGIDYELDLSFIEDRQSIGRIEFSGLSGGRFARIAMDKTTGEVSTTLPSDAEPTDGATATTRRQFTTFSREPQELIGVSLGPVLAAVFEGGPGRGRAPAPVTERATSGAIAFAEPNLTYAIGAQTVEDIRLGVPEMNIAREIDRLVIAFQAGSLVPADVIEVGLSFYQGLSVGRLSMDTFTLELPEVAVTFGEMVLERLSKDGMGLFSIGKIEARGEDGPNNLGTFALGRFAIRDVVFPTKEAIMALARLGSDPLGGGQPIEPSTRQILDVVPMIGGVELEGLAVDSDMTGPVALDRFALTLGGFVPPVPTETAIELAGLSFPTALVTDPEVKAFLEQAGIEQVNIDGRYATKWTEGANTFDLDPFALTVEGLGSAEVTMALSGVPRTVFEAPDKAQLAMPEVMVDGVTARFSNAPKLAGPLADFAKQQQISPETAIGVIGDVIRNELAPMSGDGFADSLGSAVKQFLTGPTGSLELVARPAQPVPLVQVVGAATLAPGSLVKLLNAVVEYRQ
jgi:hypothetical protein